jgi:UDP-GlcNAc:undecaprenyl-phosphate GlcNAc-1-phosphate transferase
MARQWSLAFSAAALLALAGTELARRVALAVGFVDRPSHHKTHAREIPYLGGVAIAAAALVGWQFEPRLGARVGVAAVAAVAVALVGLVDDDRGLSHRSRLVFQAAAALAVVGAGIRAEPTGIGPVDIAVTVVWIVGVTNALNLVDNMDGLAAAVAAGTAGAVFALAALGGQDTLATAAAGLAGACVGFLAHNVRPASIFMGDAGALFLGFVLSIAVLEVDPVLSVPGSLAVPLLLLSLPVLDTTAVAVARARRGLRVTSGGRDHLSHRLVAVGIGPGPAVALLVALQGALSAVTVLVGRGVVPLAGGLAIAAILLTGLAGLTARAPVYAEPVIGLRARLRSTRMGDARRRQQVLPPRPSAPTAGRDLIAGR